LVNQWEGIASIGQRNNQKSTSPRNDTEQALHAGLYKTQGKNKENCGGQKQKQSCQKLPPETKKVNYEKQRREIEGKHLEKQRSPHSSEEILTDQQLQKFQRGRYKCSRCGALKVK
jgi:DNA-directed RNA polymerase subunit M/transcription elongation factor TFIIS